jgi:hypothetical protein
LAEGKAVLSKDEAELINPEVDGEAFELLCACCRRAWHDQRGNWHVVVAADRLPLIEDAERKRRRAARAGQEPPRRDFQQAFGQALFRSKGKGGSA